MTFILIALVALVIFLIVRPYFIKYDTLVSFTGGLGSGKTFKSVETAVHLYKRQRLKVRLHNLVAPLKRAEKWELPELYSNIPVRITLRKNALKLTKEHLLLQRRIIPRSVVLIDEVDAFANQFQWDSPAIVDKKCGGEDGNFDEFCRFFRHYTKGGFLIMNTQASANENLVIRRRQNSVNNLMLFRTWGIPLIFPHIFYTVKVRHILTSEDVKTVEDENAEDGMRINFGLMPLYRRYDTYCYAPRYETVPKEEESRHEHMTSLSYLCAPKGKQAKYTPDAEGNFTKPLDKRKREEYN